MFFAVFIFCFSFVFVCFGVGLFVLCLFLFLLFLVFFAFCFVIVVVWGLLFVVAAVVVKFLFSMILLCQKLEIGNVFSITSRSYGG